MRSVSRPNRPMSIHALQPQVRADQLDRLVGAAGRSEEVVPDHGPIVAGWVAGPRPRGAVRAPRPVSLAGPAPRPGRAARNP